MNEEFTETVLHKCRELMSERISSSMATMMKEAEAKLHDMAAKEKSLGKAAQYYNAIRLLRVKQHEMQVRFEKRFTLLFKYRTENFLNFRDDTDITLSKVGHSSFVKESDNTKEKKALENSVYKVKQDCRSVLLNIDKKMSILIKDTNINYSENPMQPETIFEAFWESCRDIEMKDDVRLLFINLFEKSIMLDLQYIYEDLNVELAQLYLKQKNKK